MTRPATTTSSPPRHGTIGAVLRVPDFRLLWSALTLSATGSWMQTVILPAYIDQRTKSPTWVGLFIFAQLGPVLLLSIPGGVLADRFFRRGWIATMQTVQLIASIVLAVLVAHHAPVAAIFAAQLFGGIGNALNNPAMQGTLPNMVDPRDIAGVVSLNSVMINGTRVLGPVLAVGLDRLGFSLRDILLVNAASFLFVVVAVFAVHLPVESPATAERGLRNLTHGLRLARHRSIVGRLVVGMAVFSFFCLPFVGLFAPITRLNLGLDSGSAAYKWLYATWGCGALAGALTLGTVFAHADKRRLIRPLLLAFAATLAGFTLLRSVPPAFPVGFVLGATYFAMATAMLTVIQDNLRGAERARVMSLWFMSFGGTVAIGNLVFGPVVERFGARPVLLVGVGFALALSWWCDVARREVRTLADERLLAERGGDHLAEPGNQAALDEYGISGGQ